MAIFNISGVNLKPGSKVLLGAHESWTQEDMWHTKEQLEKHFPGVEFIIIAGMEIVGTYDKDVTTTTFEIEA